jgi:hypothetical protein
MSCFPGSLQRCFIEEFCSLVYLCQLRVASVSPEHIRCVRSSRRKSCCSGMWAALSSKTWFNKSNSSPS